MAVREGLLALLSEEPKYGYQLKGEFEVRTGEGWSLNVGQVYSTLDRLAQGGLVSEADSDDGDERRKRYLLTDAGRTQLDRWFHEPSGAEPPPRDDLLVKVLLAVDSPEVDAREVIRIQRTALVERLQQVRRRDRRRGDGGATALMMADAVAVRLESEVRWLDLCEQRLEEGAQR